MVLNDGMIKITDFGIARMRNNEVKTMTGMILGSPKYMSPEQVSGKRADTRSDIFSLGVVIYETLTGTSPFVADNIHGVMYQTMNFNPPAPKALNPDLPDVLNFIVAKALAKNLDDRYQQAKDLANDLREALATLMGDVHATELQPLQISQTPFTEPASPLTRHEDKEARILGSGMVGVDQPSSPSFEESAGDETDSSSPALGLSKAFDSLDATMRLAALTGMEKELDKFSETQKIARLKALADAKRAGAPTSTLSDSTTWQQSPVGQNRMDSLRSAGNSLKPIWLGSALLAAAAAVLFLFR
jgi:serine/threonine-protein kinase